MPAIDPNSPVPLYHQLAESIRAAIRSGRLRQGDALTPLREAAEAWGVNVHTVRHAYTSLAREGLLESHRGVRGTRVARASDGGGSPHTRKQWQAGFVDRVLGEAREHGLSVAELTLALRRKEASTNPQVHVVECSRWQSRSHAAELSARYQLEAIPWSLEDGEPPAGTVVATYFHYNDFRRLWPRRLASVRFVTIHPDPVLRDVFADRPSLWVCESDANTAAAVAADLTALFDAESPVVRAKVASDPNRLAPRRSGRSAPHLFPPRAWAALTDEVRANPHVFELRYVFDQAELAAVALAEGWVALAEPLPVFKAGSL